MFGQSSHLEKKLREQGHTAPAVVLEATQGHMALTVGNPAVVSNTELSWRLVLRVQPPAEPEFEAELHTHLPQLEVVAPGQEFTVLYDPGDHSKVAIDHSESGAVDAVAHQIASRHPGADPGRISELLLQRMRDPGSVSSEQLAAAIGSGAAAFPAAAQGGGAPGGAEDPVDLLAKLATLHQSGVLDDADFEAQKARILGHGGPAA